MSQAPHSILDHAGLDRAKATSLVADALKGADDGELRARVERIHAAGPSVKIELVTDAGDRVQAALTQERFRSLALAKGDVVFVKPKQQRVFVNDFSI